MQITKSSNKKIIINQKQNLHVLDIENSSFQLLKKKSNLYKQNNF